MSDKEETEIWEAKEAQLIAERIIPDWHPHLQRNEAVIMYLFTSKEQKKHGRTILGKAQKLPALMRFLSAGSRGEEADFILLFPSEQWILLSHSQRVALVDHELCHCAWDYAKGTWKIRGHDVEEFTEVIERHGLWMGDIKQMADAIQQLSLPLEGKNARVAMDAARDFRDAVFASDDLTSVTLSSGGQSVTLNNPRLNPSDPQA